MNSGYKTIVKEKSHCFKTITLLVLFTLIASCTTQPTPPIPTITANNFTATGGNTPPSITDVTINSDQLVLTGKIFRYPVLVNPSDTLHMSVTVQDDSSGKLEILKTTQKYTPSQDGSVGIYFDVSIPADLTSKNIPLTLIGNDGQRAEYSLTIVPGDRFAPIISISTEQAVTGMVVLDVSLFDLNGIDTLSGTLSVMQVFNPQATGNKRIAEYISNFPLNSITVTQVQPGSFKLAFEVEWPGRYPLELTAVDMTGNTTTIRAPIEIYWSKQPFSIRGIGTGPFVPGDPGFYSKYLDILSVNNVNLLQVMILAQMNSLTSDAVTDCPYEWEPGVSCTTTSPSTLQDLIQKAHDRNIQVMLAPMVVVGNWEGTWQMQPNWNRWFSLDEGADSYSNWLLKWALYAQENHVEYFEVGTELVNSHSQTQHWEELVAKVRAVYSGKIGYGDNYLVFFTDSKMPFPACPSLDFYGLQYYFHATGGKAGGQPSMDPSVVEMRTNLTNQTEEAINRLQTYCNGVPILISEMGIDAQDGSNSSPEAWAYEQPSVDFQEQVDYYTIVLGIAAKYGFMGVVSTAFQPTRTPWSYDPNIPGDLRDVPALEAIRIFYAP